MLRRTFTAVLEKNSTFRGGFETEPYEAGWASEARWFVNVLECEGDANWTLTPQVSPDGLHWCDEGTAPLELRGLGLASVALSNFGAWLRLKAKAPDRRGSVRVLIHLVLKE